MAQSFGNNSLAASSLMGEQNSSCSKAGLQTKGLNKGEDWNNGEGNHTLILEVRKNTEEIQTKLKIEMEKLEKLYDDLKNRVDDAATQLTIQSEKGEAMHNELKEGIDEIRARLCPDEQEEDEEKGKHQLQGKAQEQQQNRTEKQGSEGWCKVGCGRKSKPETRESVQDGANPNQAQPEGTGARTDQAAAQREPERAWIGGFPAHLNNEAMIKVVNKAVGAPCANYVRGHKLGSVTVDLPANVSLAKVLELDGKKNIPGFKIGRDSGIRVRKAWVGDRAGRGSEASKTELRPQVTFRHGLAPVAESQRRPEGLLDGRRTEEDRQRWGGTPRPNSHRPHAVGNDRQGILSAGESQGRTEEGRDERRPEERLPLGQGVDKLAKRGLGGDANSKRANGLSLITPAGAATKIFEEKQNLTKEMFHQCLHAELKEHCRTFSSNQEGRAFRHYSKRQSSLGVQADTSSRQGPLSAPVCPAHCNRSQSEADGYGEVLHRAEAPHHEEREEDQGADESGEKLIQKLDAFRPEPSEEPEQSPAASPSTNSAPPRPIGTAGGDADCDQSSEGGQAQTTLYPSSREVRDATEQEIRENYDWDPNGKKFKVGAKQFDKLLEKEGMESEAVPGTGACYYLAVQRTGTDPMQIKQRVEHFYHKNDAMIVQGLVDRRTITGDEVKTFDEQFRKHIRTVSSEADLPAMTVCAMAENIDVKLVNVVDGKQLAFISGQREWEQDNTSMRPVIVVGLRQEGWMIYDKNCEPIIDSQGKAIRSGGHCWRVNKRSGEGEQGPEQNGGGEGNGQEWTGLVEDPGRNPL